MGIQASAGSRHSWSADQRRPAQPRTIPAALWRLAQRGAPRRDGPLPRAHSGGVLFEASPQLVELQLAIGGGNYFRQALPPETERLLFGKRLQLAMRQCPHSTAVSVGHRNTCFKTLSRSFEQGCPWASFA